jgi:hypothetical protein
MSIEKGAIKKKIMPWLGIFALCAVCVIAGNWKQDKIIVYGPSEFRGPLTFSENAKFRDRVQFSMARVKKGFSEPTAEAVSIGSLGNIVVNVLSFDPTLSDGNENEVGIAIHIPPSADETISIKITLIWKPKDTWISGSYKWAFEYLVVENGDFWTLGAPSLAAQTVIPTDPNCQLVTKIVFDADPDVFVYGRFYLDDESTATVDGHAVFLDVEYVCDKLGGAV